MGKLIEKGKPYVTMISLQFGYAGMAIISKVALNRGMNHFVLVVYRQTVATVVLAPFAFFFERNVRPKLKFSIFCQIFVLGLLEYVLFHNFMPSTSLHNFMSILVWIGFMPVMDQNFYYLGLKLTSPTYAVTLTNVLPAMTFVMALLFRMESLNIKKLRSQAKIVGMIVCVGGAMLMTLYKGPILQMHWSLHHGSNDNHTSAPAAASDSKEWVIGTLLILAATLSCSAMFILQTAVLRKYCAPLSVATLICFLGALQGTVLGVALVREPSQWALRWDINLLTAVYTGVVGSAIAYYVEGLCMRLKGPVFATAFSPLEMIIVAVMGSIILSEHISVGRSVYEFFFNPSIFYLFFGKFRMVIGSTGTEYSVMGAVMIAVGLYAVLWGKAKDSKLMSTAVGLYAVLWGKAKDSKLMSTDQNCSEVHPNSQEIVHENESKLDDIEAASEQLVTEGPQPHEFNGGDTAISITENDNTKM
eukprot:PITA_19849